MVKNSWIFLIINGVSYLCVFKNIYINRGEESFTINKKFLTREQIILDQNNGDHWLVVKNNHDRWLVFGNNGDQWLVFGDNGDQWQIFDSSGNWWSLTVTVNSHTEQWRLVANGSNGDQISDWPLENGDQ